VSGWDQEGDIEDFETLLAGWRRKWAAERAEWKKIIIPGAGQWSATGSNNPNTKPGEDEE
jgi:hypothetical protein